MMADTVRIAAWDIEEADVPLHRLRCAAEILAADVLCVQGLSGWAGDGRLELLARALGMSAHVACDPSGGDVVIFTGPRVEMRQFLVFPAAVATLRIDDWELTVVATQLCAVDATARQRHVRTLSSRRGRGVVWLLPWGRSLVDRCGIPGRGGRFGVADTWPGRPLGGS